MASLEELKQEAQRLPERERLELALSLLEPLIPGEQALEVEQAWEQEIQGRIDDILSGRVTSIPAEEVEEDIEAALKANRAKKG